MANPSITTITIDGHKFNALATHFSVATHHDHVGVPQMGSTFYSIEITVDMHDTKNMPFDVLQKLFGLASRVTRDSIVDIKIEFWIDENQQDVICTYSFRGWITNFSNSSGAGGNHTLNLSLQPALDENQFVSITMGN